MEAESALTGPPLLLERAVLFFLPYAAREAVGGDLCEIYHSPLQYGWQATRVIPFVVASQARRNANLPLLGLQSVILFTCLQGFFAMLSPAHGWAYAAAATMVLLLVLLLHDVYQPLRRPSSQRAILETILLAGTLLLIFPQLLLGIVAALPSRIWWPGFALLGCFLAMVPALCGLRALLILEVDRRQQHLEFEPTVEDVPRHYYRFIQGCISHDRLEGGALVAACFAFAFAGWYLGVAGELPYRMMIGIFAAAAAYLLLGGSARLAAPMPDLASLCAHYQSDLARRHQMRRFLSWLWGLPLFLLCYIGLIRGGIDTGAPSLVTLGILAVLLLGFFIGALNREGAGPVLEKIALLGAIGDCES
jgi:hypothetical protein